MECAQTYAHAQGGSNAELFELNLPEILKEVRVVESWRYSQGSLGTEYCKAHRVVSATLHETADYIFCGFEAGDARTVKRRHCGTDVEHNHYVHPPRQKHALALDEYRACERYKEAGEAHPEQDTKHTAAEPCEAQRIAESCAAPVYEGVVNCAAPTRKEVPVVNAKR